MEKTKECKKCKKQLPIKEFPKDNRAKDKLWRFCRACESARKKAQRLKNKANMPQTKSKGKGKTKKGPSKKTGLKVYFRTKCSMEDFTLGHYASNTSRLTGEITNKHITIFLPRLLRAPFLFDELFSEVLSHEFIHYLIHNNVDYRTTHSFDIPFGKIKLDAEEIGNGLSGK